MTTRYSYGDLQAVTENFNKELGGGGFDTAFEGTLTNGTKVIVKHLDDYGQIKKSFLSKANIRTYVFHLLGTYVTILFNWLIL